ncbi:Hypothetical protein A7982_10350 [Minicystis rosea]|nr:Hypothetical protein A7982_10350 [Minicystis rosea]
MDRDERDDALARLRAATEALAPDEALTEAIVSAAVNDPEDPLRALAHATRSLDATNDFTDAVMARVPRADVAAPSWMDGVVRTGPVALGLGVLAVAASFVLFFASQGDVDATMASSVDAVEVLE